jgi:hypothetical protein
VNIFFTGLLGIPGFVFAEVHAQLVDHRIGNVIQRRMPRPSAITRLLPMLVPRLVVTLDDLPGGVGEARV